MKSSRQFIELLLGMTVKELRARYKQTVFGFLWIILNPLLQMLVIGFVFTFFIREPIRRYYYYLFIGLLIWNFFSLSLTKTTPCVIFDRSLVKKARFPHAILPLSIILSHLVHFILALLLYTIPVLFLGTLSATGTIAITCGFILLILFTVGLSLCTSALNVRFRDINFFVQAILIVWFYATPVIYSFDLIPRRLIFLWRFNPLTSVVQLFQHGFLDTPMPGPDMLTANTAVTIITLFAGILIFRKESRFFDDWI